MSQPAVIFSLPVYYSTQTRFLSNVNVAEIFDEVPGFSWKIPFEGMV